MIKEKYKMIKKNCSYIYYRNYFIINSFKPKFFPNTIDLI